MLADAENLRFPKLFHCNKTTRTIIIIIIYLENALQLIKAVIKKVEIVLFVGFSLDRHQKKRRAFYLG